MSPTLRHLYGNEKYSKLFNSWKRPSQYPVYKLEDMDIVEWNSFWLHSLTLDYSQGIDHSRWSMMSCQQMIFAGFKYILCYNLVDFSLKPDPFGILSCQGSLYLEFYQKCYWICRNIIKKKFSVNKWINVIKGKNNIFSWIAELYSTSFTGGCCPMHSRKYHHSNWYEDIWFWPIMYICRKNFWAYFTKHSIATTGIFLFKATPKEVKILVFQTLEVACK